MNIKGTTMATLDKLNAFQLLRMSLESEVKEVLANDIIDEQVKLLKSRLRSELEPILQAVTFEHIENYKDLLLMRDELRVYIKVNDNVFDTDDHRG